MIMVLNKMFNKLRKGVIECDIFTHSKKAIKTCGAY